MGKMFCRLNKGSYDQSAHTQQYKENFEKRKFDIMNKLNNKEDLLELIVEQHLLAEECCNQSPTYYAAGGTPYTYHRDNRNWLTQIYNCTKNTKEEKTEDLLGMLNIDFEENVLEEKKVQVQENILGETKIQTQERSIIYILKLINDKYYIGKTTNLEARFKQHVNGSGSEYTKIYPPIEIFKTYECTSLFDEDKYVKEYMLEYGIDNVRGGTYSMLVLNENKKISLKEEFRHATNCCFKCGKNDHFAKNCTLINI